MTDEVFDSMELVHHFRENPKHEFIYFEAHLHNALYFLKEGYVNIGYYDKEGREVVKEIIDRGDVFGQFTLLQNNLEGEFAQAYKSNVSFGLLLYTRIAFLYMYIFIEGQDFYLMIMFYHFPL